MESRLAFEEWSAYAERRELRSRQFPLDKVISYAEDKIVTLTGVRRSGKSSLMVLLFQLLRSRGKKVAYISAEDPRLEGNWLDELLEWFGDDGYLLIDEITSVPGWDGWLARVHELTKPYLHLIVTSSKSYLQSPSRPLRGRSIHMNVHPLTFSERLSFLSIQTSSTLAGKGAIERELDDHLRYGGFPEVVLAQDQGKKQELLSSYFREILALDVGGTVGAEANVVGHFGRYLLKSPYFSATACHNAMQSAGFRLGKEKVLAMESAAADCLLFRFLHVRSNSVKDLNRYPRKSHPGDLGFYWSVAGSEDLGRRLETMVCLEMTAAQKAGEEIDYWRDNEGREVDILLSSGGRARRAVQVCHDPTSAKTLAREVEGLRKCADDTGAEELLIVTRQMPKVPLSYADVGIMPALEFLREMGPGREANGL
jgi:predicted AAA+ superfamily ATPase